MLSNVSLDMRLGAPCISLAKKKHASARMYIICTLARLIFFVFLFKRKKANTRVSLSLWCTSRVCWPFPLFFFLSYFIIKKLVQSLFFLVIFKYSFCYTFINLFILFFCFILRCLEMPHFTSFRHDSAWAHTSNE